MASLEDIGTQIRFAAHEAWSAVGSTLDKLTSSLPDDSSRLKEVIRPPVDRTLAAFRWSNFGRNIVVPFPAPRGDDPRMIVTIVNLVYAVYNELEAHQIHPSSEVSTSTLPIPPVTLALIGASVWRYFNPVLLREVCLSPYCVVDRQEVGRLWSACLTHMEAVHLMSNIATLLPNASALERQAGSGFFAADVALLSTLSSGLFVGWAMFEKELLHRANTYYAVGALGLSSLAFGLQVVADETRAGSERQFWGLPVPRRFTWVLSLGLTHLVTVPDSSFAGHMCGVLAGIAHVYMLRPAVRALLHAVSGRGGDGGSTGPRPRFYGAGTLSGRPVSGGYGGGGDWARGLRRSMMGALSQLGMAAAVVGVYALASQRRQRQPLSNWSLR